ncbi:NAD(P)-binding protein [Hypoxylon trugodes]|uniref:NAD(P)-binding protein n=1 Tax=Hypoxylon trugodes TaxID=326681 RepID=UPI0021961467|nr:NAD(P)-binding protein [Hypoxylon trugodes]KAI1389325.1 NAD(P)-binding protein [Hypoxylon trugodes]
MNSYDKSVSTKKSTNTGTIVALCRLAMSLYSSWTQFFPPRDGAPLKEVNLPSQVGKVFIVTGGSSGLGYELSRILYGAGGKVYILTRTKKNAEEAIARIQAHYPEEQGKETGSLEFIHMDLEDFNTVKSAAREFLSREGPDGRLDVLFNNAGTGSLKDASPSRQGHEYHFTTNSLGGYVLARLLTPILTKTAQQSPKDSVRVIWPTSLLVEAISPKGGVRKEFIEDEFSVKNSDELYASSKAANWFLASEFSRRQSESGPFGSGVVHIAGNPGNYTTGIWRHVEGRLIHHFFKLVLRDPVHGAETYLWMAFSEEITLEEAKAGRYVICDGRWHPGQRKDLLLALKGEDEGGSGRAKEYFEWCEVRAKEFVDLE